MPPRRKQPRKIAIGTGLRHARKRAGLTQSELAELLGVTRGAVAMWENGYRSVRTETLLEISDVTGAGLDSILDAARRAGRKVEAANPA